MAADPSVHHISPLRNRPAIVILGEPSIGKTTLLTTEAAAAGVALTDIRNAVDGLPSAADTPPYLDGLDEYRIDGGEADKVFRVAFPIRDLARPRWRLPGTSSVV